MALANLETFVQQTEKELFPDLSYLDVQNGKLVVSPWSLKRKISQAFQRFISPDDAEHQAKIIATIQENTETIKNSLPYIQVMSNGNQEKKRFSEYAKTAIERFNRTLDKTEESHSLPWQKRLIDFFYRKKELPLGSRLIKIEITNQARIQNGLTHRFQGVQDQPALVSHQGGFPHRRIPEMIIVLGSEIRESIKASCSR